MSGSLPIRKDTRMKKAASLALAIVAAHGLPILARLISKSIDYSSIQAEPVRELLYVLVTYALQVALTLLAIRLFLAKRLADVGFNLQNRTQSGRMIGRFMIWWTGILLVFYTLALLFMPSFMDYLRSFCQPGALYLVKSLAGGAVLAGLGEEPLYRALIVTVLAAHWQGEWRIGKLRLTYAALLSGIIFMTAHVGYVFLPQFTVTHLDPLQLCYTFVLGVVWATMYQKTRSLLASTVSHIFANAVQYGLAYAVVALVG